MANDEEGPKYVLPEDPGFLAVMAQFRYEMGYGNLRREMGHGNLQELDWERTKDPAAKAFDDCVIGWYQEAVARFFWKRLMKLLRQRGIITETSGKYDYYSSISHITLSNNSTVSRWSNKFERRTFPVRPPGSAWASPSRRGVRNREPKEDDEKRKRYEPALRQFTAPFAVLGISPEDLGLPNGWIINLYATREVMARIRNEILGQHELYPPDRLTNSYALDADDFRLLYRLITEGAWMPHADGGSGILLPHEKQLLDLWLIPFGLICSVSESVGGYIWGFSDDDEA